MDLLSALIHEVGHVLGLHHQDPDAPATGEGLSEALIAGRCDIPMLLEPQPKASAARGVDVRVAPWAVVGEGVSLGDGARVASGAQIGAGSLSEPARPSAGRPASASASRSARTWSSIPPS